MSGTTTGGGGARSSFAQAVDFVNKNWPQVKKSLSSKERLQLYGMYKVASEGRGPPQKAPLMPSQRHKWKAWKTAHGKMDQGEARKQYLKLLREKVKDFPVLAEDPAAVGATDKATTATATSTTDAGSTNAAPSEGRGQSSGGGTAVGEGEKQFGTGETEGSAAEAQGNRNGAPEGEQESDAHEIRAHTLHSPVMDAILQQGEGEGAAAKPRSFAEEQQDGDGGTDTSEKQTSKPDTKRRDGGEAQNQDEDEDDDEEEEEEEEAADHDGEEEISPEPATETEAADWKTEHLFENAVAYLRDPEPGASPPSFSNADLLKMSALYKQATEGPCKTEKPDQSMPVALAKWQEWNKLGHEMSRTDAKKQYISLLRSCSPEWYESALDALPSYHGSRFSGPGSEKSSEEFRGRDLSGVSASSPSPGSPGSTLSTPPSVSTPTSSTCAFSAIGDMLNQRQLNPEVAARGLKQLKEQLDPHVGKAMDQIAKGGNTVIGSLPKVELAPLDVPLERRLQTFFTLLICTGFLSSLGVGILFLYWGGLPRYAMLGYLLFIYFIDKSPQQPGSRHILSVQQGQWCKYFRDYFPISLIKTTDLEPAKNYIFGYHPHGIISHGAFTNFATDATGFSSLFPGVTCHLVTLSASFKMPFLRELLLSMNMIDASRQAITRALKKGPGESVCIVLGGAAEALDAHPGTNSLTLAQRKGFVKIGLLTGSSLVPCFSFGENDLYSQIPNPQGSRLREVQTKMQKTMGFSMPFFYGRGVFNYTLGLLPRRVPVRTVVGKPIHLPKVDSPSQAQINEYHDKYCRELQSVYDQYKDKFAPKRRQSLVIS